MSDEENGVISFKYQGLYYGFKFRNEVNFDKLGDKITGELKNMTLQDYEIMKELVIKIPKQSYHPYAIDNFTGIMEILNTPTNFNQLDTEISETDRYSYIYTCINYIYIIDLDKNKLLFKKILYNEENSRGCITIKSEEIKEFDLTNL